MPLIFALIRAETALPGSPPEAVDEVLKIGVGRVEEEIDFEVLIKFKSWNRFCAAAAPVAEPDSAET